MFTEKQKEIARQTAATTERTFAELRRGRMETQMTGRIRAAWAQLDVATEEIVRLMALIKEMTAAGDPAVASFQRDLDLEIAKAMGKAEVLAILMPAPMNSPQAVSIEAGQRWSARQAGQERETPGLRMVAKTVMEDLEPSQVMT